MSQNKWSKSIKRWAAKPKRWALTGSNPESGNWGSPPRVVHLGSFFPGLEPHYFMKVWHKGHMICHIEEGGSLPHCLNGGGSVTQLGRRMRGCRTAGEMAGLSLGEGELRHTAGGGSWGTQFGKGNCHPTWDGVWGLTHSLGKGLCTLPGGMCRWEAGRKARRGKILSYNLALQVLTF